MSGTDSKQTNAVFTVCITSIKTLCCGSVETKKCYAEQGGKVLISSPAVVTLPLRSPVAFNDLRRRCPFIGSNRFSRTIPSSSCACVGMFSSSHSAHRLLAIGVTDERCVYAFSPALLQGPAANCLPAATRHCRTGQINTVPLPANACG